MESMIIPLIYPVFIMFVVFIVFEYFIQVFVSIIDMIKDIFNG